VKGVKSGIDIEAVHDILAELARLFTVLLGRLVVP